MAAKKKGNKKQSDEWENELGADPIAAATEAANAGDDVPEDDAEDEAPMSGLMAALKKNKKNRAKKGKPVEDFVEGEDPAVAVDLEAKAPVEASLDDEDVFSAPKKPAGGKKQPTKDDEDEDDGGGLKSAKQKEKERKEREKQRKKEQAAKKKSTAPTPAAKEEKKIEEVKIEAPAADDKGGKKKKVPAHLAAIQRQQELLKKQQEEAAKRDAEEAAAEAERLRKLDEEDEKTAAARARRKEREKEKKEQLKKEGKLLTDAEKKKQAQQQLRAKQMLESGVKVAGLEEGADDKKRSTFDKKKKKPVKTEEVDLEAAAEQARVKAEAAHQERLQAAKEAEQARLAAEAEEKEKPHESDGPEDWEQAADEEVKDDWDADSEEEEKPSAKFNGSIRSNGTTKELPVREAVAQHGDRPIESESESDSEEDSSDDEGGTVTQRALAQKKAEAAARRERAHQEALAARSKDNLRSPICCILGHVDTGKTKLLDKIRQTNVQGGEAGGITQQIGATYFPVDALEAKTQVVNKDGKFEFKVPGLLVIDTPGHESFSNLRSRGSSLCNIAILVIDIMHGLEPQTIESMNLLRARKTPFIVALNKIDRLYGWKKIDNNGFQDSLAMQSKGTAQEFRDRLDRTKLELAEKGFNSELFYENKSLARNVSLVPTSAHTGEGIPDMLKLLVSLSQERMTSDLMYLSEVVCTVLEVKVIEGLGTTIDVILSNGVLHEGDRIVLCGINGAISTDIRALLTPAPLKELRLKSEYVHNKEVKAALGVKIAANGLEGAIAGSRLLVVGSEDDESDLEDDVMADLQQLMSKVSKDARGVSVQASTLGSLEALLDFLKVSKIPVANIGIGPVFKRDIMMAGTMLEKAKQYAVMLCFDVKVDKEAEQYAADNGIKVFTADIIYHLFDDFTKHMSQLLEQKKEENKLLAVFPAVLTPIQVFNKKDPIVIGVDVTKGSLRPLTPIAAVRTNPVTGVKEIVSLGRV
jgi:translation initiation factor 5B